MKSMILALGAMMVLASPALATLPSDPVVFIGEDFEGNLVVLRESDLSADHSSAPCPAPAPCVNGPHTRSGFGFISHGFFGPFQGAYVSSLIGEDGNARVFNCNFGLPAGNGCSGQGTFPGTGQDFYQVCAFGAATGGCRLTHF